MTDRHRPYFRRHRMVAEFELPEAPPPPAPSFSPLPLFVAGVLAIFFWGGIAVLILRALRIIP